MRGLTSALSMKVDQVCSFQPDLTSGSSGQVSDTEEVSSEG